MKLAYLARRCVPHLLASTVLLSCAAKSEPVQISVQVPLSYKGGLYVSPCSERAGGLDDQGRAYAHECPQPGQEIQLVILQGSQTYRISSEKLNISKTGDGIPVEISTTIQ